METRRQRIAVRVCVLLVVLGVPALIVVGAQRNDPDFPAKVIAAVVCFFGAMALIERLAAWINRPEDSDPPPSTT